MEEDEGGRTELGGCADGCVAFESVAVEDDGSGAGCAGNDEEPDSATGSPAMSDSCKTASSPSLGSLVLMLSGAVAVTSSSPPMVGACVFSVCESSRGCNTAPTIPSSSSITARRPLRRGGGDPGGLLFGGMFNYHRKRMIGVHKVAGWDGKDLRKSKTFLRYCRKK